MNASCCFCCLALPKGLVRHCILCIVDLTAVATYLYEIFGAFMLIELL